MQTFSNEYFSPVIDFSTKIDKDSIIQLVDYFTDNRGDVKSIFDGVSGELRDTGKRMTFEPFQTPVVKRVDIDYEGSLIGSVLISGDFDVSVKELGELFGPYTKSFVPYDENLLFHFKTSKNSQLFIHTSIPESSFQSDQDKITNLHLIW
ncbi:hypothetical protein [Paraflavitalea sp. CAU 1676]|uniref:hypothetical protein n=1 Tax=Paraflavitalea sp. CAU 1676 TaxID=3032598 RepID=UPI0023D9E965|nr:hypothetical protein [Paraflavitalea sp. CAU 1676]MDF2191606.1 hypothetical protein [Paraflavitalea sp. CAU 1676]